MLSRIWLYVALSAVLPLLPARASDESEFCSDLQAAGLAQDYYSQSIFYKGSDGQPVLLNEFDSLSKSRNDTIFYYLKARPSEIGNRSVINVKFAFKSGRNLTRKDRVDVRNSLWDKLSQRRRQKIANDCAHVNVDGYDRFHLNNTRDYCLRSHFHQRAPEFETLATVQRRESFAFGDMIGESPPGLAGLLVGFLGPRAAQAAAVESEFSAAPYSLVRSLIQNFSFGKAADRCVAVRPNYPEDAQFVRMRVNYMGTDVNDEITQHSWRLKLTR